MAEQNIRSEERDLGLGSRVATTSTVRFLNQDGTFNARRAGIPWYRSMSPFQALLTLPSWKFYSLLVLGYIATNLFFGLAYYALGPGAISGSTAANDGDRLTDAFFFSVHTLATIGYGVMSPQGFIANMLVTLEALLGLLGIAMATGLTFARFSRPSAALEFSREGVIAPYRGGTGFMFRFINVRRSQLIETEVKVVLSLLEDRQGRRVRQFYPLTLERTVSIFFPLHWTVVHPIDDSSPLKGRTAADLATLDAEFVILVTATDETFFQTVHTRTSYKFHEVRFGARFSDMFIESPDGTPTVDTRKLHDVEPVELPS